MIQQAQSSSLERILRVCVYMIALIPLVIFKDFISPFHFGKVVLFRSFVDIMVILYILLLLQDRSFLPKPTKIFWAVTFFTIAFGITTATSVNVSQSFWGTLERMGGWFTFVHFWAFFVIMTSVLRTKEQWITLLKISVFASLISTLYGFLQKTNLNYIIGSGGRARIFGTLGNAALFAGYTLLNMYFAFYLFFTQKDLSKVFFGSVFVLNFIAVIMTAVRGSIGGLIISMGLFSLWYFFIGSSLGGGSKKIRNALMILIGGLLAIELLLISAHNTDFVRQSGFLTRISDVSLKTRLIQTRFWAWQAGYEGWKDSPKHMLVGWGPENFNIPFSVNFNPKFYTGPSSETLFDRAHNMFVEILSTMGLLGMITYLGIFFVLFFVYRKIYRQSRNTDDKLASVILACAVIGYIVHNFLIFDTSANFVAFFVLLGFSNVMLLRSEVSQEDEKKQPKTFYVRGAVHWWIGIALGFVSAIALFGEGLFGSPTQFGVFMLAWMLTLPIFSELAKNELIASPIVSTKKFSNTLVSTVGVLLAIGMVYVIYNTNYLPLRANYAVTRGILLASDDQHKKAIEKFKEAINFNTFLDYEFRNRYMQHVLENYGRWKSDSSINVRETLIETAEEGKKNFFSQLDYLPYLYVNRIYLVLGKSDPKSPYNDLALQNSLKALEIAPKFIRTYYEIGQGYLNKGEYQKAIDIFVKAAELNPETGISWWYVGITEAEAGNYKRGAENMERAKTLGYNYRNEHDLAKLIEVYAKLDDLDVVIKYYRELVIASPNNAKFHANLATAFAQIGKIDDAVREAKAAAAVDKTYEKDARVFVNSLGRTW